MTSVIEHNPARTGSDLHAATVDPLENGEWDSLLPPFPDATAFHTSAWARVLARTYCHKPLYLRFDRAGQPVALVPLMEVRSAVTGRRGVCLPFTDSCAPLIDDLRFEGAIAAELIENTADRNWKYAELRGSASGLFPHATTAASYYVHKLPLTTTTSALWDGLVSSVRRAIRKAGQSKISAEVTRSPDAVAHFYRMHVRTRRRHGVPPQPFRFFENIYDEMIRSGLGFIVLVKTEVRPIAAAVFFEFGGTAIYKFGASDVAFQELRPSNLMVWEAIRALAERGCALLHFGRTDLADEGLRRFKLGWGATEQRLDYLRLGRGAASPNFRNQNHSIANAVFRRMPLSLNKLAGAVIYPHCD